MDRKTLEIQAARALERGDEAVAEQLLERWLIEQPGDTGIAHWRALLLRALDRRDEAVTVLTQASRHAPGSPGLLHALAHITLEAGLPCTHLFAAAIETAPDNLEARIGLVSARFADGDGRLAQRELASLLADRPDWLNGHRTYAQLAAMLGEPECALETVDRALQVRPDLPALHQLAIDLLLDSGRYEAAAAASEEALTQFGALAPFLVACAAALDELGERVAAKGLFDKLATPRDPGHALRLVRHLLRTGEIARAAVELEPWLAAPTAAAFWPLAALAWRAGGDTRIAWLEEQAGLVRIIDLDEASTGLTDLVPLLRRLHQRSGRFLDQSVQNGTQTDGPFFGRIEPEVKRLRAGILEAVDSYVAALPGVDSGHPTLRQPRDKPIRFAGSWSVRLTGAGYHTSHHHPQGWISSAFYAAVPVDRTGDEGRLVLGEGPDELGLGLPALCTVEPKPGRLVLFPSFMWHATRPFANGERLSIAFDVAPA